MSRTTIFICLKLFFCVRTEEFGDGTACFVVELGFNLVPNSKGIIRTKEKLTTHVSDVIQRNWIMKSFFLGVLFKNNTSVDPRSWTKSLAFDVLI